MNNNNLKNLKHILNKCELARPIPLVEQKHIKKSRRKIMKNVFLSASGKFGFFEGLVAWVFLGFTNFGVRLSVFQSAVVVVIASVAVVAVISSGSYFAVAFFSSESPAPAAPAPVVEIKPGANKSVVLPTPVKKPAPAPAAKSSVFVSIKGEDLPKEDLARFKSLVQVFFLRNIKDPVKKYGVMGSVIQLEPGSFIVSLEALDISNINVRTVIFVKNKQVSSIQEISPALLDLSKDAISEIKLRDKK